MRSTLLSDGLHPHPTPTPAPAKRRPLFLPREHGAYALVLAPLLTAFCRGGVSWGGAGFALAAVAAFLAHEPALVLLAQRGGRVAREQRSPARWALGLRALVALGAGGAALATASATVVVASAAALGLGALQGLLVLGRQEKSDIGTLLSALTAAAAGVPVALANAWDLSTALLTNAVFAVMGGVAMLTVRELIPKRKREAGLAAYVGWLVAVVAVLALATRALSGEVPAYLAWALAPTLSASVALLLTRPAAKHLRAVGWTLAAANVATFLVLAFA